MTFAHIVFGATSIHYGGLTQMHTNTISRLRSMLRVAKESEDK
jgi:hypothetical protein